MARVRSLTHGTQAVKVHPTEVDCFYQQINSEDGRTYLHLTTFGSDDRASKAKSSQSIQLDEDIARQLVRIVHETFPS